MTDPDVSFLRGVIIDNERWNSAGISEGDLSVVFEMSEVCAWGRDYAVSRFKQALQALGQAGGVTERAKRWYAVCNPTLEAIDERGARVCGRRGCGRDISHLRLDARFCSPGCRNRVARRQQGSDYPLHRRRSGTCEKGQNPGSGTGDPSPLQPSLSAK